MIAITQAIFIVVSSILILMPKIRWLGYSLSIPVIVIIIVALAEELVVTSLLGVAVSAAEMALLLKPNRTNPS
jgi:hypothetical protein